MKGRLLAVLFVSACTDTGNRADDGGSFDGEADCAGDCPTVDLPHCDDDHSVRRSARLHHAEDDSPTFSYVYKAFAGPTGATTAIVLNGGPGATLLDFEPFGDAPLGAITTAQFSVIYTDQRGS